MIMTTTAFDDQFVEESGGVQQALAPMTPVLTWQPIETAPKDKRILLYRPTASEWWRVMGGHYDSDEYLKTPKPYWGSDNFGIAKAAQRQNPPTHWMPLPESPK